MKSKINTTWGSKNAEAIYDIATALGGFDPVELMLAICQVQKRSSRVNEPTILQAMQNIIDNQDQNKKEDGKMYAITYGKRKLRRVEIAEAKGTLVYASTERAEREVIRLKKIFPRDKNKFAVVEFTGNNGYFDD